MSYCAKNDAASVIFRTMNEKPFVSLVSYSCPLLEKIPFRWITIVIFETMDEKFRVSISLYFLVEKNTMQAKQRHRKFNGDTLYLQSANFKRSC